jgi:hypothetical protein
VADLRARLSVELTPEAKAEVERLTKLNEAAGLSAALEEAWAAAAVPVRGFGVTLAEVVAGIRAGRDDLRAEVKQLNAEAECLRISITSERAAWNAEVRDVTAERDEARAWIDAHSGEIVMGRGVLADAKRGLAVASALTLETQTVEEACADLVRQVRDARAHRDEAAERDRIGLAMVTGELQRAQIANARLAVSAKVAEAAHRDELERLSAALDVAARSLPVVHRRLEALERLAAAALAEDWAAVNEWIVKARGGAR